MIKNEITCIEIFGLWYSKNFRLKFKDNNLILVGENGSGKTTILRIIFYVLSCKWADLSLEKFEEIRIFFSQNTDVIVIEKKKLRDLDNLFVKYDSELVQDLPIALRRRIKEKAILSGDRISYYDILEIIQEVPSYNTDNYSKRIMDIIHKSLSSQLREYEYKLKNSIDFTIFYLPTYRRIEKNLIISDEYRHSFDQKYYRTRGELQSYLEIASSNMDDIDLLINEKISEIREIANETSNKLNYDFFKGIINKDYEKNEYNFKSINRNQIDSIFKYLSANLLNENEKTIIIDKLSDIGINGSNSDDTYSKTIYFLYTQLQKRQDRIDRKEKELEEFFSICNNYLNNKKFKYIKEKFSYQIVLDESRNQNNFIQIDTLSSGEKQLITMFAYLYLSKNKNIFLMIDEPELSLSITWQKSFILDILNGKKCIGILAVTHSPFIVEKLYKYTSSIDELEI